MKAITSLATHQPVLFVISMTVLWYVLAIVFTGIGTSVLRRPFGDAVTTTVGRLAVTACLLLLAWRMGWLEASGIARLGGWKAWLLALAGLAYFACASLYAFYGKVTFDFSSLVRMPEARSVVATHFVAGLSEEILFRGVVLYGLVRVWGNTRSGIISSVVLASLLFAAWHLTQVFTNRVAIPTALMLVLETWIISIWWAAVVLLGGSIWPAVMLHFMVNAVVAVQGLSVPVIEPEILVYRQLLWFSVLPGLFGIGLLVQAAPLPISDQI